MNSLSILVIANVIGCCKALQSKFQRILARLATVFVSEGRLCLHREGGFITVLSCGTVSH